MLFGDLGYVDKPIYHWLGQILYILFAFLIPVVLMNLLNGLAVDDIRNIMLEVNFLFVCIYFSGFLSLGQNTHCLKSNILWCTYVQCYELLVLWNHLGQMILFVIFRRFFQKNFHKDAKLHTYV